MKSLLLVALLAPPALARAQIAPAAAGSAAGFDRLYAQLTGPASLDADTAQTTANLRQLRALLPTGDTARELRLRAVHCVNGDWATPAEALTYADESVRRARAAKDLPSEARSRICRAYFLTASNAGTRALAELDHVIAQLHDSPQRQLLAEALTIRGGLLSTAGNQVRALQDFLRARSIFRTAGFRDEVDPLLLRMAAAYARIGDWPQAERHFLRLITRMQAKQHLEGLTASLIQLGQMYLASDAPDKAKPVFERALATAGQDDSYGLLSARMGLTSSLVAQKQATAAQAVLAQINASNGIAENPVREPLLLLLTGQALALQGQHPAALQHYQRALPLLQQDGNPLHLSQLYKARSASLEALGQDAAALADYRRHAETRIALLGSLQQQQLRLLESESEQQRREADNQRLRAQVSHRQQQLEALQRERRWQGVALLLSVLLIALLSSIAWRQWRKSRQLRTLAMTDPLTGALNRRAIEASLDQALQRAASRGQPASLLLLDLDHFKAINDRHGHAAGDAVLRAITRHWQTLLRDGDRLGRIGGEEFVVLCPNSDIHQAGQIAQRLLEATHSLSLPDIDPHLRLSTSIGLAEACPGESRTALLDRADAALYRAKQAGRDRMAT